MFTRRKIAALVAEFLGTGILAFIVLTVSRSQIGIPYFVAIAAGIAVMLFGLALGRDVHLNPAYTFALWTGRRIKALRAFGYIIAQMLGGLGAYAMYKYFAQNGVIQPVPSDFKSTILVAEFLGTFAFTFIASGAIYRQAHPLVRSVVTGGAYTLGVIIASVAAAGFINPAVAVASNAWALSTYVLGPLLGALLGVNLYGLLFANREDRAVSAAVNTNKDISSARVVSIDSNEKSKSDHFGRSDASHKLNKEAIEVAPANVDDRPLEKVGRAEKHAKKNKKSKK